VNASKPIYNGSTATWDMLVTLDGADWIANDKATHPNWKSNGGVQSNPSVFALHEHTQAWLFDGAIAVFEKTMRLNSQ
jgi:hypothetical protein